MGWWWGCRGVRPCGQAGMDEGKNDRRNGRGPDGYIRPRYLQSSFSVFTIHHTLFYLHTATLLLHTHIKKKKKKMNEWEAKPFPPRWLFPPFVVYMYVYTQRFAICQGLQGKTCGLGTTLFYQCLLQNNVGGTER